MVDAIAPNPLDYEAGTHARQEDVLNILAWTMLGEAANQGDTGLAAIAAVIKNRAESGRYPADLKKVALQPQQFSTWNKGQGGNQPKKHWPAESEAFQHAKEIARGVVSGEIPDPTGGATHYWAPTLMKAYGKEEPSWAKGEERAAGNNGRLTIGDHVFIPRHPVPPLGIGDPVPATQSPGLTAARNNPVERGRAAAELPYPATASAGLRPPAPGLTPLPVPAPLKNGMNKAPTPAAAPSPALQAARERLQRARELKLAATSDSPVDPKAEQRKQAYMENVTEPDPTRLIQEGSIETGGNDRSRLLREAATEKSAGGSIHADAPAPDPFADPPRMSGSVRVAKAEIPPPFEEGAAPRVPGANGRAVITPGDGLGERAGVRVGEAVIEPLKGGAGTDSLRGSTDPLIDPVVAPVPATLPPGVRRNALGAPIPATQSNALRASRVPHVPIDQTAGNVMRGLPSLGAQVSAAQPKDNFLTRLFGGMVKRSQLATFNRLADAAEAKLKSFMSPVPGVGSAINALGSPSAYPSNPYLTSPSGSHLYYDADSGPSEMDNLLSRKVG